MENLGINNHAGTGLNLFLLLDGHGSHFELMFLNYANAIETMWECCIGLPDGTSYWQVGGSTEQNGCFKMGLTRAKQESVNTIDKIDIVGLVHQAWKRSFA
jgi:hypothetical protein